jgi:uncharacterized protein (DUF433 family)
MEVTVAGPDASPSPPVIATPRTAARLIGVTVRQIGYWRTTGLVVPGIAQESGALYTLGDLIQLRTVADLRRNKVSLQHIRSIVTYLRDHYDAPLRELRFEVYGGEVYIGHPDGVFEASRRPGQPVINGTVPIAEYRDALLRQLVDEDRRKPADHGKVESRHGVKGGRPVFAGTRNPVTSVQSWISAGHDTKRILAAYPDLTRADIDVARRALAG